MGSDEMIAAAAKVSVSPEESLKMTQVEGSEGISGLINYLMKQRHGSPFEHNAVTFFVHAPIFVFREWQRHRISSYNEWSGRYSQMLPEFYIPNRERNLFPVEKGYKASRPEFRRASDEEYDWFVKDLKASAKDDWDRYARRLDFGYANEVSRMTVPLNMFSKMWATANLRSWLNFISLRTHNTDATFVSYPMKEINDCADIVEATLNDLFPLAMDAFNRNGRICP